jgi:hypothetical protein
MRRSSFVDSGCVVNAKLLLESCANLNVSGGGDTGGRRRENDDAISAIKQRVRAR